MSDQEINIAIAEACGWKVCPQNKWLVIPPNSPHSVQPLNTLPDYCNDLNAMHEAEKVAFGGTDLWQEFVFCLIETSGGGGMSELDGLCCLVQATARQRAEAFLRMIGKWKEAAK